MAKTLDFWVPLLARTSGFLVVITPLTLLGDRHVKDLMEAGISAINIDSSTSSSRTSLYSPWDNFKRTICGSVVKRPE